MAKILGKEYTYTGILVPLLLSVRSDQHFVELLSNPGNCHLFAIFWLFWNYLKVQFPLGHKVSLGFVWSFSSIFTTYLQEKVSACPTIRPSVPCSWYSHGRACSLSPAKCQSLNKPPLLFLPAKSPDSGAWGRTWLCRRHPWPWQSPCARRGPSRCTAAHTPSPGRASCGRCGSHIWAHIGVERNESNNTKKELTMMFWSHAHQYSHSNFQQCADVYLWPGSENNAFQKIRKGGLHEKEISKDKVEWNLEMD